MELVATKLVAGHPESLLLHGGRAHLRPAGLLLHGCDQLPNGTNLADYMENIYGHFGALRYT